MNQPVPVMRPQLPSAQALHPYLERIDAARWYSNHGPLLFELEARMAKHFGVTPKHVAIVANGTVALSAALVAVGAAPGSRCILPSWTFVGSAAAAWAANLQPHFVDVSAETWMLDPAALMKRTDLKGVGAVMTVSAFGAPVDTQAWDAFTEETGIPVIIDGAASFDTAGTISSMAAGRSPIMISLHATKAFGIGEGGLLLCTDESIVHRFNQVCNFGVWDSPAGQILGYNGKLNEYNAAVGLAMLDIWSERRANIAKLTREYVARLGPIDGVSLLPGFNNGWVSTYCNILTDGAAAPVIARLQHHGIETRRWWQSGVHVQNAYRHFQRDELPVTENLATRVFGLPFFHDLRDDQVDRVVSALIDSLS